MKAVDVATGAAADAIAAIEARRAAKGGAIGEPVIGPDEADAVQVFFALGSQWRWHAMAGVRLGIDYSAVPVTAGMMGITMTPGLFDDLRVMEGAAMAVFAQK